MKLPNINITLFTLVISALLISCHENWDNYYKNDEKNIEKTILQGIEENATLSTFTTYLKISGFNKQLSSALSYSVWAQTNDIIADFNLTDTMAISNYIGYCISVGNYIDVEQSRIKMLNGKYALLNNTSHTIEGASFDNVPEIYQNGLLFITSEKFEPKKNIWEIYTDAATSQQKQFIETLYGYIFDESASKIIGVDQETGLSVYDSVKVYTNKILMDIANLDDEENLYTFIMLSDAAYSSTVATYKTYFTPLDSASVDYVAAYNTCSDLVISGKIETDDLPVTVESITGIEMTLELGNIINSVTASNGIIYYVSANPVTVSSKFKEIVIEGEDLVSAKTLDWSINPSESASGGYELYYEVEKGSWAQYNFTVPYPAKFKFSISAITPDTLSPYNQYIELLEADASDKAVPFVTFDKALTASAYNQLIPMGEYIFQEEKTISIRIYSDGDVTPVPPISLDRIIITPTNQ